MNYRFNIQIGEKIIYESKKCVIIRVLDLQNVSIEEIDTNIIHTIPISKIETPEIKKEYNDLQALPEEKWDKALKRFEIIKPILVNRGNTEIINKLAAANNVSAPTIYRWLKAYDETGLVSSLIGKNRGTKIGKYKLDEHTNQIINDKISSIYLTNSKQSITKTIRAIQMSCKDAGIQTPHSNTIRNRIKNISEEEKIRKRFGHKKANEVFNPIKSSFPGADYPLSVVQIDHTPVDIILVDEHTRQAYKRPYLTLAMDVYSRAVLGFYLSYDPPSSMSVGMCVSHSILPKENWLNLIEVTTDWPCFGIMDVIHVDNAKEFHGKMLRKATQEYGIELKFRPVATPHYGGHIERILGSFAKEIHNLPGTTFSNIVEKGDYNSKDKASLTLSEFEKWLTIYITKIYHNRIHSSISDTPINKLEKGFLGDDKTIGKGIPQRIYDERKVKLDFLPYIERTVQEYGIVLNHIYYYDEVLRPYINSRDNENTKTKYLFRTDPRDISVVYFFDPILKDYYEIPYRNTSLPPISIWEYKDVVSKLKKNKITIDEDSIFAAYRELEELEYISKKATRKAKNNQKNDVFKTEKIVNEIRITEIKTTKSSSTQNLKKEKINFKTLTIQPFEDIE